MYEVKFTLNWHTYYQFDNNNLKYLILGLYQLVTQKIYILKKR